MSGLVSGLGFMVSGLVFGVLGGAFVFDISDITVGSSGVGHNLDTAIGQVNSVGSLGVVSVSGFTGLEVGVAVVIGNGVCVFVFWGNIGVGGFVVGGGRGVVSGGLISDGNAGKKGNEGDLRLRIRV